MKKLITIQKRNNLNEVYRMDAPGAGGACHEYAVIKAGSFDPAVEGPKAEGDLVAVIKFQHGPRNVEDSVHGVLDTDLLEMVRDRLIDFNKGEYATRENALAITCIEEALLWMNKRVEDRFERGVLGTMNK
jgi:hypothetical protein